LKKLNLLEIILDALEQIIVHEKLIAIIVRSNYEKPGISFFTPDDFSQQLAYMKHPQGKIIKPHIHNPVPREVQFTEEVLIIKKGCLRVDFYDEDRKYVTSRLLGAGDIILLAKCGHGFEALEDLEMIEVKQGPYVGEMDKVRFEPVDSNAICIGGK
jgi:hypothetical protein